MGSLVGKVLTGFLASAVLFSLVYAKESRLPLEKKLEGIITEKKFGFSQTEIEEYANLEKDVYKFVYDLSSKKPNYLTGPKHIMPSGNLIRKSIYNHESIIWNDDFSFIVDGQGEVINIIEEREGKEEVYKMNVDFLDAGNSMYFDFSYKKTNSFEEIILAVVGFGGKSIISELSVKYINLGEGWKKFLCKNKTVRELGGAVSDDPFFKEEKLKEAELDRLLEVITRLRHTYDPDKK